jgi:PBP1b-binding outer membrane lipoprotein LpoB
MKRIGLALAIALVVVGCSSGGVPLANLPPAGTIWFGSSFDATTFAMTGQASTFAQGDKLVMVAHFTRIVPSGQGFNFVVDRTPIKAVTTTTDTDVYGLAVTSALLPLGPHAFEVDDAGGNSLASGTVTITP